jgi:hypothetical protein
LLRVVEEGEAVLMLVGVEAEVDVKLEVLVAEELACFARTLAWIEVMAMERVVHVT